MAKKHDSRRSVPPLEAASELIETDRTVLETAAELRCSPSTVYRLINASEITAYKRGERTIIEGKSIADMKERNRIQPAAELSNVA